MKPNFGNGAKWRGNYDKKIYTVKIKKNGEIGYVRQGESFRRFDEIKEMFPTSWTYVGGGTRVSALSEAKSKIAALETELTNTKNRLESERVAFKSNTEYYNRESKDLRKRVADRCYETDVARAETRKALTVCESQQETIVALKRQIGLMVEVLKVSQGAVV